MYSWNSTDGVNCVSRIGVGDYSVQLPGLGPAFGGTFQVTAYGGGGEHCKVYYWGPLGSVQQVRVLCFDPAGAPVDTRYALNFFGQSEVSVYDEGGYAWANDPTSASYAPSATYAYDSGDIAGWPGCVGYLGTVTAGKISPTSPGRYFMRHQYLPPVNSAAHSTAYGSGSGYCKVEGWSSSGDGAEIRTRCYGADGTPQDSQYIGTYATSLTRGPC
jgi:hypothetical protein